MMKDRLAAFARSVAPAGVRARIKAARSLARKARRAFSAPADEARLSNDLRRAGIVAGDTIVVHSSLSSMTNVVGGAPTVIAALMSAVTPEGTILMPAFTPAEDAFERSRRGDPVDLRTLGSVNGKITDVFRTMPGIYRSSHPFSPICAWGKHAEYITSGHHLDYRIAHRDSPLARLLEFDGKIVGIGTTMGTVSFYHVVEDTWDEFPFSPYGDPEEITYVDWQGRTVTRAAAHYDRAKTSVRIDNDLGLATREFFARHMKARGIRHDFTLAGAPSFWMPVRPLYDEMQALARRGITIYSTAGSLPQ